MRFSTAVFGLVLAGSTAIASKCRPSKASSSSVISSASPSPSPQYCQNLISNPKFSGWSNWGISTQVTINDADYEQRTAYDDCAVDVPNAPLTCYSVYFMGDSSATDSKFSVYQENIPIEPDTTYTITFRYLVNFASGTSNLKASLNGIQLANIFLPNEPREWKTFTTHWLSPSTSTPQYPDLYKATLTFTDTNGDSMAFLYISDVFMNTCTEGSIVSD